MINLSEINIINDPIETQSNNDVEGSSQTAIFGSIANHFANAIPQVFLYLPSNPVVLEIEYQWRLFNNDLANTYGGLVYSPRTYAKTLPYWWWDQWDGKINPKSWLPLGVNVLLISLGVYQVWTKKHWAVLIPILALIGMVSVYALVLGSGGRWLQPVDWISTMFFSIGLVYLTRSAANRFGWNWMDFDLILVDRVGPGLHRLKQDGGFLFLVLVFIGALPVIVEAALPNRYPVNSLEVRLDRGS